MYRWPFFLTQKVEFNRKLLSLALFHQMHVSLKSLKSVNRDTHSLSFTSPPLCESTLVYSAAVLCVGI